ncbi:MAG: DUF2117 domain-containing protein [Euryarchaeota archaeon]|nr:DUF2117 domain-containing protein [Euryarchaeota archaeon]MBV1729086.1 DUF2117 domain-containing protein [Methanobacterium sp.]MBU4547724.1 DUF2117 domain-containing protein [Euryarchaeota archaeon]MBU4608252.1 DUF2117 domain-containing protein [Euryarchaeota archaeon]MBV1755057.1 DUF2117 domain-containing protein [Methanobacterium sp.]
MRIGVVVHGPHIVDSGHALKIIQLLQGYGEVKARLGGTMGRTAVHDAHLENIIDISSKRLPSASVDKFHDEGYDVLFLINYGKSSITGHGFGYKVFKRSRTKTALIQIERPGEADGSVIPWRKSLRPLAREIASKTGLKLVLPSRIIKEIFHEGTDCGHQQGSKTYRKLVGVAPDENIFLNGIVVGKSTSEEVILVSENGTLTGIIGGEIKPHGVEKLGSIDLNKAVVKTGLLRRSNVIPRIIESTSNNSKINISFLNHAAEDVYLLKNADYVVTIGDDTTLVAADILYRFNVPIIGITDGDLDQVVENGFKTSGSMIIELESGWDDIIGEKIFFELFKGKQTLEINDIENFKREILHIINNTAAKYHIKQTLHS